MRWVVLLSVAMASCTQGLQDYGTYIDLRILALQAEPPELLYDSPGPLDANVTAVVVQPQGGPVSYTWSLCPITSSEVCDDFASQVILALPSDAQLLQQLRAVQLSGVSTPVADANGVVAYPIPPFNPSQATIAMYGDDLTVDLYAYYERINFLNEGLGAWPSVVLQVTAQDGTVLEGEKRIVIGVLDFSVMAAPLAQRFGITLCPSSGPQPTGCLSVPAHTANTNPVFEPLQMAAGGGVTDTFSAAPPLLTVAAGSQVRFNPQFTPASYESFFTLRADLQTRRIEVQTGVEQPSVSWFCSAGSFSHDLTWPKFTKNLQTVYTAPNPPPPGGQVTVWLVGRDQRGGVTWMTQQLQISE